MSDAVGRAEGDARAERPPSTFGWLRRPVPVPLPVLLVAVGLLWSVSTIAGPAGDVADAVQPYAPRGVEVVARPEGDWLAVEVRAGGFRPNSVVLLDVDGLEQRTAVADASGVVDVRVPLPDRIEVRLRGVALDGGGIDLADAVVLVRDEATGQVVVLLAALALGLVVLLVGTVRRGRRSGGAAPDAEASGTAPAAEG